MRYKDTDYLHAAARVTYLENQLFTMEDLLKAVDATDMQEVSRLLSGKPLFKEYGIEEYEKAFEKNMAETYDLVEDITGEMGLTHVFRYPIDGHNMKVYIKSKVADGDFSPLYKEGGVMDTKKLIGEIDEKNFGQVPKIMGQAALEAIDTLAKTGDSQMVDIIIDKAVLEVIGEVARKLAFPILSEYVTGKIDWINLKSALRLLRMKKDTYAAARVFAPGGRLSVASWEEAYGMGYDGIKKAISSFPGAQYLGQGIDEIKSGKSMEILEQVEDQYFREIFDRTKIIAFGIEPVIFFLYQKEREIRGCRLVIVSKLFDLPRKDIVERLRLIYGE